MSDTSSPHSGRRLQARRLAEQALAARRRGDAGTADRLFAEADRIDPGAVADVLAEVPADTSGGEAG